MRTVHYAFCVCILSVLQPLRAFRENQEAATLRPSSKAKKIEEVEKQLGELKLEDERKELQMIAQAKKITNLTEEITRISERMDLMEGVTNPVEQMAEKLKQRFQSTGDEETFWKNYDVTSLCGASQNSLCKKSPDRFKEALRNPCMRPRCYDKKTSAKGSREREKKYFLRWSEVFCMHLHRDKGSDLVLDCIDGAINLLNSTNETKFSSKEWAKPPVGKQSVIFWSRIPESMSFSKIEKIPRAFLLSSTLLGALTRMPKVGDLEACEWDCQKDMWASNSEGLIKQMPKNEREYFVTGMNILKEIERPFVETVAFRVELPALAGAHNKLGEVHLASLNEDMTCDDLTMAIKMSFGHEAENSIDLRCARCHHCLRDTSSDSCFADCITGAPAVREKLMVKGLLLQNGRAKKAIRVGLVTTKDLVEVWGLTIDEVRQAEVTATVMREAGFSVKELKEGGFTAAEVCEAEVTATVMREAGFSVKELKECGFTAAERREAARSYQEAFDLVWGMRKKDALAFLKKSRNQHCKEVFSDLKELRGDPFSLHGAAERRLLRLAETLLRKGTNVEAKDENGNTPLLVAVKACRYKGADCDPSYKVVELLLQNGANVEAEDENWEAPLIVALKLVGYTGIDWKGRYKLLELLLRKGANVEATDKDGESPLIVAINGFKYEGADWDAQKKVVELLLQKGADVQVYARRTREKPITYIMHLGQPRLEGFLTPLLKRFGAYRKCPFTGRRIY